jgi:poly-gamma-glutamate synthesis protein (capsule biosynthesis protein)
VSPSRPAVERRSGLVAACALAVLLAGCSAVGAVDEAPTSAPSTRTAPGSSSTPTSDASVPDEATPTPTSTQAESSPTAEPGSSGSDDEVTLLFTGEVLMHASLIDQALQNGGGRDYDFRPMFTEIRELVSGADLAVCHLELPVIPDGQGMEPRYATPPQVVDALADAGFDRCSTASNHALDRGAKGSDATLAALARVGMTQAGTASSAAGQRPQVLDVGGFQVAHLSYTEVGGNPIPAGQPWRLAMASKSRIVADVRKARALGAEYVAVSIHDADELAYTPTANQTKWDEWLAENADVDLVIGTGSHVPEPEENDNGAFVMFGLGNLINWRLDARDSVIAQVRLTRDGDGGVVAAEPTLIPTYTDEALGYQVLDVREHRTSRYASRVKADLAKSWNRIKRYVAEYVEPLSG